MDDGLVWRVRSGLSIQVFKDRWIPKPFTFKPIQNGGLAPTAQVSDLILLLEARIKLYWAHVFMRMIGRRFSGLL